MEHGNMWRLRRRLGYAGGHADGDQHPDDDRGERPVEESMAIHRSNNLPFEGLNLASSERCPGPAASSGRVRVAKRRSRPTSSHEAGAVSVGPKQPQEVWIPRSTTEAIAEAKRRSWASASAAA